jgi:hypothetical protein
VGAGCPRCLRPALNRRERWVAHWPARSSSQSAGHQKGSRKSSETSLSSSFSRGSKKETTPPPRRSIESIYREIGLLARTQFLQHSAPFPLMNSAKRHVDINFVTRSWRKAPLPVFRFAGRIEAVRVFRFRVAQPRLLVESVPVRRPAWLSQPQLSQPDQSNPRCIRHDPPTAARIASGTATDAFSDLLRQSTSSSARIHARQRARPAAAVRAT